MSEIISSFTISPLEAFLVPVIFFLLGKKMDKSDEVFSGSCPVSKQRCHHVKSKALQPHPKVQELRVLRRNKETSEMVCVWRFHLKHCQ